MKILDFLTALNVLLLLVAIFVVGMRVGRETHDCSESDYHWIGKMDYYFSVQDELNLPDSTWQKIELGYQKYSKKGEFIPYP